MSSLGKLESLAWEHGGFAADVAAAEFVRTAARSLKAMRERADLTQSQLGEMIGLTQGRVSQLESGLMDHAPNLETIALYADACGESVRLEASGEPQVEADPMLSIYAMGPHVGSSSGLELVCNVPSIRWAMTQQSGITHVRGSVNRLRLNRAVSASVMHVLGVEKG
jgi:transcriptional regulator with XRE-family HTH domain